MNNFARFLKYFIHIFFILMGCFVGTAIAFFILYAVHLMVPEGHPFIEMIISGLLLSTIVSIILAIVCVKELKE